MRTVSPLLLLLWSCVSQDAGPIVPDEASGDTGAEPMDTSEGHVPVQLAGVDTSTWVMATERPAAGEALEHWFVFAGSMDESLALDGHWTDVYRRTDTGEVVCAVSWQMRSDQPTLESGCDASWNAPSWDPAVSHGSMFCEELLGYDPMTLSMDGVTGLGWCVVPSTLCTLEQDGAWLLADWPGSVERFEDGFIVQQSVEFSMP